MLAGCGDKENTDPNPNETGVPQIEPPVSDLAEYNKITPEEALRMEPLYLDVRTQEEYDGGHIPSAVLLPVDEVAESAETVLPDNGKVIFVYCRTGARSERASKTLLDMGYTNVYDLGGIVDWTGKIINSYGYIYFNYFGTLPEDEIEPLIYTTFERIGDGLWLWFTLEGVIVRDYRWYDFNSSGELRYSVDRQTVKLETLTIKNSDESYIQVFDNLDTENHLVGRGDSYGLTFADFNFDGFVDISLWRWVGGTARNYDAYYWLWDNDAFEFVTSEELERLNNVDIIRETQQIREYTVYGTYGHHTWFHEYIDGTLTLVKSVEVWNKRDDNEEDANLKQHIIDNLGSGELIITDETYEIIRTDSFEVERW
jgi:rhodanese-related sulfurtransferase